MEIQYVYSLVAICLLSTNVYASTTSPTPSSQGVTTNTSEASSTVETASSSTAPTGSSIAAATSTPTPSTSAGASTSSTSVASPTTSPAETPSTVSVSTETSPVTPGSTVVVTTPGPPDSTPAAASPSSTSNQSSTPVDTSPSSTSVSSASSVATSPESVDTSSVTQPTVSASPTTSPSASESASDPASASSSATASAAPSASSSASPDTNNASSTPSPTPTTEYNNDSSVESSPTSPSSPSASTDSNTSDTPVEGSTGGVTSVGPDSNTSDASSPAASASPSSTDSTASSQSTTSVESTAATTPAPPVTQPPLSTSFPSFSAKTDVARYQLPLVFTGDNNGPTTSCNDTALQSELEDKLKTTDGYSEILRTSNKKFSAIYKAKQLYGMMANATTKQLQDAMSANPSCFNYTAYNDSFQQSFGTFAALTDDYCKADEICNTGYTCKDREGSPLCLSLCEGYACQNYGVCVVVVKEDGQAAAQCRCTDNNEQVFSGAMCEVARMNPDRVAAIVGAVLGAFCFILLVALYCMCYRKRERSGQKYQLSGVYNETYERSSLDMKSL